MLDFGFSEILLIFVLALVVLGPEKLPRVASQVGRWIGRARGMARQFREQLEEEINLEEARKAQKAEQPERQPAAAAQPAAPAPALSEQPTYPDHYSHAHPTDELGRPIPADAAAPAMTGMTDQPAAPAASDAANSGQQDWIGGDGAAASRPASNSTAAGYAPSHGRGT